MFIYVIFQLNALRIENGNEKPSITVNIKLPFSKLLIGCYLKLAYFIIFYSDLSST